MIGLREVYGIKVNPEIKASTCRGHGWPNVSDSNHKLNHFRYNHNEESSASLQLKMKEPS